MRIVCPVCSATYEVRDTLLAPGRAVRCTRCGEQWLPVGDTQAAPPNVFGEAPGLSPQEQSDAEPARLTAMERLASQPAQLPGVAFGLRAAWAASLVVLLLFGWGLITWRTGLMHAWPPSIRLYDAIGLAPAAPPAH
jgi:predicted Zn finger-like uncharacterized protein